MAKDVFAGGNPYFDETTGKVKIPKLERLSPGVYRNPLGRLVDKNNRAIRRRSQPQSRADRQVGRNLGNLTPQDRAAAGIDPRDPNQYWRGPDGNIFGTLMGWYKDPSQVDRMIAGITKPAPAPAQNDQAISDLVQRLMKR